MDDLEIIELYFCRDEKALTETAHKYGNYCYTVAFNILNSIEDSKETVNDTYFELWNTIPPERPTFLSAFIGKITRRLAIGRWRKNTAVKRGGGEFMEIKFLIKKFNDPKFLKYDVVQANNQA